MNRTALFRAALLAATALAGSALAHPAAAQSDAQIQVIEKQIKALQSELARVKAQSAARDQALKAAQEQAKQAQAQAAAATAQSQAAAAQSQAVQAKVASIPAPVPQEKLPMGTFRVGGVTVTLGGFTAAEGIYRSRNQAASIDTSFNGGIPFANSPNYYTPEFRLTAQQSRFSLLAQGDVGDAGRLTSYMETDFLSAGSSSNNNQSNSYTLRVRQFWGGYDNTDLGLHFLAGQAWSLASPYRIGLIPRQENVPLTIDAQYVVGFTWERQAAVRVTKDFMDHRLWAGVSLEEPATIFSGAAGPNCLTGAGSPLTADKTGTLNYAACGGPNVNAIQAYSDNVAPDIIAKIAADPGFGHYELYGLLRFFSGRVSPAAAGAGTGQNDTITGEGIGGSMILPVISRKLDFQVSGLAGQGVGRYGSGQLPDVTFNTNGRLVAVPSYQVMGGFVAHPIPSVDVYLYGGTEQAERKAFSAGGATSGYGIPTANLAGCYVELGSCPASASGLVEGTIGAWWRVFKGGFGTAQVGAQYEYINRTAFSGTDGKGGILTPSTNENAFLFSFRYLPFQ